MALNASASSAGIVMGVSLAALLLAAMDSTVVSTLLPAMMRDLGGSGTAPWLVSGFILAQTLAAPLFGSLSDAVGVRTAFALACILFAMGSGWVALAPSVSMAIAARILQGLGAGGIVILVYTFVAQASGPNDRPKRQGMISGIWGIAAILGPLLGMAVEFMAGWRWVFLLNLPILGVLLYLLLTRLPTLDQPAGTPALDPVGLVLISLGVTAGLLAMTPASTGLAAPWRTICILAAAGIAGVLAVRCLSKAPERTALISGPGMAAIGATAAAAFILYATITFLPIFLQTDLHKPVAAASMIVLAGSLGWVLGSLACGRVLAKLGYRKVALAAAVLMATACALLGLSALMEWWLGLMGAEFLLGLGMGGVANTTLLAAQNHSAPGRLGTTTGTIQLARSLGGVIGVNLFAALTNLMNSSTPWALSMGSSAPGTQGYALALFSLLPVAALAAIAALKLPITYATAGKEMSSSTAAGTGEQS
ncbi:MFS transporter [Mesoterricola sediminis]|nr:MFS transporter [Mesoterricola sediminis]